MVTKSNIKLCDGCNTRVATRECFICGADMCNFCRSKSDKYIGAVNLRHLIDYCKNCYPKLNKIITDKNSDEILKMIKETLNTHLRKRLILDKLEDKGEK